MYFYNKVPYTQRKMIDFEIFYRNHSGTKKGQILILCQKSNHNKKKSILVLPYLPLMFMCDPRNILFTSFSLFALMVLCRRISLLDQEVAGVFLSSPRLCHRYCYFYLFKTSTYQGNKQLGHSYKKKQKMVDIKRNNVYCYSLDPRLAISEICQVYSVKCLLNL